MPSLKELIKRTCPAVRILGDANRRSRRWLRQWRLSMQSRQTIFSEYFEKNQWADGESRSGEGSNMHETQVVRKLLPQVLRDYNVSSILDIPCGDLFWMSQIDMGDVSYIGGDIVEAIVKSNQDKFGDTNRKFLLLDACETRLPDTDMIFCRDALVHLSNEDAVAAIRNFQTTKSRYLLTTTFTDIEDNINITTGMWRPLNLCKAPFNFPEPIMLQNEMYSGQQGRYKDKSLGLWRMGDIRNAALI